MRNIANFSQEMLLISVVSNAVRAHFSGIAFGMLHESRPELT